MSLDHKEKGEKDIANIKLIFYKESLNDTCLSVDESHKSLFMRQVSGRRWSLYIIVDKGKMSDTSNNTRKMSFVCALQVLTRQQSFDILISWNKDENKVWIVVNDWWPSR